MRTFVIDIDPETNRERAEKRLSMVSTYMTGQQVGPVWKFPSNRVATLIKDTSDDFVFVKHLSSKDIPKVNRTKEYLEGKTSSYELT